MSSLTLTGSDGAQALETVEGEVVAPNQEAARAIETQIKDALREGKAALWKLSEALYHFNEQEGWRALGYENLSQWLLDPEIDMTRGTYYRQVRTWQKLAIDRRVDRAKLEAVNMSKAALVADAIEAGTVRPAIALRDVGRLSASALREKYGKPRRGRPPKGQETGHSASVALREAARLPWEFVEEALSGRAPLALREARLREALKDFLAWRDEYLPARAA
jgi:hypothetical protein